MTKYNFIMEWSTEKIEAYNTGMLHSSLTISARVSSADYHSYQSSALLLFNIEIVQ